MSNTGLISPSTLTDLVEARMEAERAGEAAGCERARLAEQASAAANAGRIEEARALMAAATARDEGADEADSRRFKCCSGWGSTTRLSGWCAGG